jgi:hypothetical protein
MGQEIEQISDKLQEAERRVQATRDQLYASQVLSGLELHMEDVQKTFGTKFSGDEAQRQLRESAKQFVDQALVGTTDDRVKNFILTHADDRILRGGAEARRRVNHDVAVETDRQAREQITALNKMGTVESTKEALNLISGLSAGGLWTGETAERLKGQAIADNINNAAATGLTADPRAELMKMNLKQGVYQFADDADLGRLKNTAVSVIHQRMAEEEKAQKQREKAAEEERKAMVDEYDSRAAAGTLTLAEVENGRRLRILTGDDYRRVLKSIQEPKTGPSDPDLLATYLLDAESATPKYTAAEIDKAYYAFAAGNPGLNLKDAADIKGKLRARANDQRDKGETDIGRRHTQAEQQLRANLGITGLLEAITQDQKKAYSMALGELTSRSSYFGGKEDPIAIVEEISPRYQSVIRSDFDMSIAKKRRTLSKDDPNESVEANMKRLEKDYQAGKITKQVYENEKRIWLDIDRDTRDLMKGSNATTTAPGLTGNTRGKK